MTIRPVLIAAVFAAFASPLAAQEAATLSEDAGSTETEAADAEASEAVASDAEGDVEVADEGAEAEADDASVTVIEPEVTVVPADEARTVRRDAPTDYITADALQDARIVSLEQAYTNNIWSGDEPFDPIIADLSEIGDVDEVILGLSGAVVGVTTDVGGFLGIGDKRVLLPLDDLRLARTGEDGEDLIVVTRMSRETLEEQVEFELDE